MLLVALEESLQVGDLDVEFVQSQFELECWQLDEFLLLWLWVVLVVLVAEDTGNHGEDGEDNKDLVGGDMFHWLAFFKRFARCYILTFYSVAFDDHQL